MAVSYLNRLNSLFYAADEAAISLDTYTWFHSLMVIFRELSTEMKDAEIDEYNKIFLEIGEKVNNSMGQMARTGKREIGSELYNSLHTIEIKLRKVLKGAGLQLKMADNPRLAK